ncbi:hypothetical protein GCM10027186_07530 [Micromonospora schwarzwaldensis]
MTSDVCPNAQLRPNAKESGDRDAEHQWPGGTRPGGGNFVRAAREHEFPRWPTVGSEDTPRSHAELDTRAAPGAGAATRRHQNHRPGTAAGTTDRRLSDPTCLPNANPSSKERA